MSRESVDDAHKQAVERGARVLREIGVGISHSTSFEMLELVTERILLAAYPEKAPSEPLVTDAEFEAGCAAYWDWNPRFEVPEGRVLGVLEAAAAVRSKIETVICESGLGSLKCRARP